jgi:KaiC/GvpD/RAD55 family RecA-like ATPase
MTKKQLTSALFGALIAVLVVAGFVGGALVHMAGTAPHSDARLTGDETHILALVAAHAAGDGRYDVVMPETATVALWADDPGMAYDGKDFIATALRKKQPGADALVDRLYETNAKSVQLTLASAPGDGYVVDDGSYGKYFQFAGGGWRRLREAHPQVAAIVRFARPVYDEATGRVLVYVRTDTPEGGSGIFHLYSYQNGALTPLAEEKLWAH